MYCRFENRLENHALVLHDVVEKIEAYEGHELTAAWQQIEAAQAQGYWVALILNYELGAHLLELPFAHNQSQTRSTPTNSAHNNNPNSQSTHTHPASSNRGSEPCSQSVYAQAPLLRAYVMRHVEYTTPWGAPSSTPDLHAKALVTKQAYLRHIAHIQQGIHNGDYYQVNYSIPIAIQSNADPKLLYQHLAHAHPVAYGAYIADGAQQLLSFSPELFVKRQGDHLLVKPMKGTTARHTDPTMDQAAAQSLRQSEKDIAENIMIVDLLRNDLGRIATTGTVRVSKLLEVEAYPSVWTMTSTIEAEAPQIVFSDLMTALFPCGSITGTPKIAAMQCIHDLEQRDRGIYCGSIGWLAPNGDLQLNVAIRTIEYTDAQTARFGVGGAIVIDSDPAQEWQECLWKARVLGTKVDYDEY